MAIKICNDYNQFNSLNGMHAQLFNAGTTFNSNNIPIRFLTDLINQENGFHVAGHSAIRNTALRALGLFFISSS